MLTIYHATAKRGAGTFTIVYSPALRMFKTNLNGLQSLETRHTLPTSLDRLKPILRNYVLRTDELENYLR